MEQQTDFDIERFEQRVNALLDAYKRLQSEYEALKTAHQTQNEQTARLRERLNGVIERIRVLETEADSAEN